MEVLSVAAAVAWAGLVVNLVVMPFFNKGEKLHQDYRGKGEIDAAFAAIESTRLIPTLARIFQRARDAQEDKRSRIDVEEMEELLQRVDFLPDLEQLQSALTQKTTLLHCFNTLNVLATKLWKWGLAQVATTLALPLAWHWLGAVEAWEIVTRALVTLAWATTLGWTVWRMFQFHRQMATFLACLHSAKEPRNA